MKLPIVQRQLAAVLAASGELLWSLPFKTPYDQNVVTPLLYKEAIVYSGLEQGTAAVRLTAPGGRLLPEEVWRAQDVSQYMRSPVAAGRRLFAFSPRKRGTLVCLNAAKGTAIWQSPESLGENACILSSGGILWLLTTGGELIVLEMGAASYAPLHIYKAASSPTWAHPVILRGRVLVKDATTLASLRS